MKKVMGFVVPVVLVLAVFIFMVGFKQEPTLSNHEKQDIAKVKVNEKRMDELGLNKQEVTYAQRGLQKLQLYDGEVDGKVNANTIQAIKKSKPKHPSKELEKRQKEAIVKAKHNISKKEKAK